MSTAPVPVRRVAVIGLGRMGAPMAANIARAGHDVVLHNRTRATALEVAAATGAAVADSPREAAAGAEVVVTMLADASALRSVLEGPDGVLAGLGEGTVLLDMGTTGPAAVAQLRPVVEATGAVLVDAPVSGSVAAAEAGELTLLVGGPASALEVVRPVLDAVGRSIHHLGPTGSGAVAKLAVNGIIFAIGNAVSESLVVAERAGIDREAMYDLLEDSAVAAPMVGYRRDSWLDPDGTPPTFSLALAAKDLRLLVELAASLGVPVEQARTNLAMVTDAADAGLADNDMADVAVHLRDRTGDDEA